MLSKQGYPARIGPKAAAKRLLSSSSCPPARAITGEPSLTSVLQADRGGKGPRTPPYGSARQSPFR